MTTESEYLQEGKLLGEDFNERMLRFGLICENAHGNWDLSDRDVAALRTALALLIRQRDELIALRPREPLPGNGLSHICLWEGDKPCPSCGSTLAARYAGRLGADFDEDVGGGK